MITEIKQFELSKHGKTKYNVCWGYGVITYGSFTYKGLVMFAEDYQLVDGSIYEISKIHCHFNKKNIFTITLALK